MPFDTSLIYKDYKYQYKLKRSKSSLNKTLSFDGCKAKVVANKDSVSVILTNYLGPRHFKFFLWLKDTIYIVYVDNWTVTKVCKVDESINPTVT